MDYENTPEMGNEDACSIASATGTDGVINLRDAKARRLDQQAEAARAKALAIEAKAAAAAEEARLKAEAEAEKARLKAEAERAAQAEAAAAMEEIKREIREEFLAEHDISYVASTDCWWHYHGATDSWTPIKERAVRMIRPDSMWDKLYWSLFMSVMAEDGRHFRTITSSFAEQPADVLNMLRPQFCPMAATADYDGFFDVLLHTLANGDPGGVAHIEQLILAKWQRPQNYLLPALAVHNEQGGAGKNLFVEAMLGTVFGRNLVADGLSMNDITSKFNSHLIGKAVWFVDESVEDKVDENALKRLLGSRQMWVEPKGLAKFQVENTALLVVAGNGVTGSVRVVGSEVDRRISVIEATRTLKSAVAEQRGCTVAEAEQWVRDVGQHLLRDREQVGRWLRAMQDRHGDLQHVAAFHGDSYKNLVRLQRPFHDLLFDALFKDEGFQYIRRPLLYEAYRDLAKTQNSSHATFKNRTFYAHLDSWSKREGIPLEKAKVNWRARPVNTSMPAAYRPTTPATTADIIYRPDRLPNLEDVVVNDERYGGSASGWNISI
ncbi:primase-helicase family protein [Belnapia sp. F-4-1]|uniref:primase-helicase family protein n=1 Tax=Belnapia sp. F-4-1 TaxID=1545443 RepID=UPI0005B9A70E|nr:primase-helicase family protein [Belnapia sp. F-4-1]